MKLVIAALRLAGINARQELSGIFRYLGKSIDWDLRILSDGKDISRELSAQTTSLHPDGIIIDATCPDESLPTLIASDIPLVTLDLLPSRLAPRTKRLKCIRCDDGGIGIAAARHFLGTGAYNSFAFVHPTGAPRTWAKRRAEAFRATLAKRGHSVFEHTEEPDASPTERTAALMDFLRSLPKPAAVLAAWDDRARQVLAACRAAKLSVPRQVAIMGVDNDEMLCEHTTPALSSVIPDTEQQGYLAAKTLDQMMNRRKDTSPLVRNCPITGVAVRESTMPTAPAAKLVRTALAFIRQNYAKPIGVRDVVDHLGVSRRLADRRFREIQNATILETITRYRLEHLKRNLLKSKLPIAKLIPSSGFGSINQAKLLFRRDTGLSMRDWRAQHATKR